MWLITCSEHDDVTRKFDTEELAEAWLDENSKSARFRNCDLWTTEIA